MPDRVATLKEMLRVLVPDGRLAVLVWGSIGKCPAQTAMGVMRLPSKEALA